MDPDECLKQMLYRYSLGEIQNAMWEAEDLRQWILRGGFEPKWTQKERMLMLKLTSALAILRAPEDS